MEPSTELPEWLSKLRDKSPTAKAAAEQSPSYTLPGTSSAGVPPKSEEPLPDWLQQMQVPSEPPSASFPALPEPSKPEWAKTSSPGGLSSAPAFDEDIPGSTGSLPSWLADAVPDATPPRAAPSFEPPLPAAGFDSSPFDQALPAGGAASSAMLGGENPAGWDFPAMGHEPSAGESTAFSMGGDSSIAPAGETEMPGWLATAKQEAGTAASSSAKPEEPPAAAAGPSLQELLSDQAIPEWLSKPTEQAHPAPTGKPLPEIAAPAATEDGIEQADLPRWLEAMRPIQAVKIAEEDERVENIGPLAGLRGVITAEPVVAMPRRPYIMANNIDASPQQTARAELLQRMIVETEWHGARRSAPRSLWEPLVRRLIAAMLIFAVVLPWFVTGLFARPAAGTALPVVVNFAETIGKLDPKKPALVAFDYDPSAAPEMEIGARTALSQLAARGVPVAIISTEPTGPTLGEILLLQNGQKAAADYGYLPGGASGLRTMAGSDKNGGAGFFTNYSVIVVIANKPQTVRDWVEQVHTVSPGVPMMAVVSAASDALVFPYTQGSTSLTPQLAGLVSGYAGAESYRAYAQQRFLPAGTPTGGSDFLWEAFGMAGSVATMILLAGMIASLLLLGMRGSKGSRNVKH
jgi:hypothetical protein